MLLRIELRQALTSYQDYHMLVLSLSQALDALTETPIRFYFQSGSG